MTRTLSVHTREGVISIPLSGDPKLDAYLIRWAQRGGKVVTTSEGEVLGGDPEAVLERAAIQGEDV